MSHEPRAMNHRAINSKLGYIGGGCMESDGMKERDGLIARGNLAIYNFDPSENSDSLIQHPDRLRYPRYPGGDGKS